MEKLWILSRERPALDLPPPVEWVSSPHALPSESEILPCLAVGPGPWDGIILPASRLLLLPGEVSNLLQQCTASCVMSYGISSKDSITLSSMDEDGLCSLAIQRELITRSGGSVERQEVVLRPPKALPPLSLLFYVGLLPFAGTAADDLPAHGRKSRA